jgi:hypothetical protein
VSAWITTLHHHDEFANVYGKSSRQSVQAVALRRMKDATETNEKSHTIWLFEMNVID